MIQIVMQYIFFMEISLNIAAYLFFVKGVLVKLFFVLSFFFYSFSEGELILDS